MEARVSGLPIWGISAVGSALHSHCRGREFESHMLQGRASIHLDALFYTRENSPHAATFGILMSSARCFLPHVARINKSSPHQHASMREGGLLTL